MELDYLPTALILELEGTRADAGRHHRAPVGFDRRSWQPVRQPRAHRRDGRRRAGGFNEAWVRALGNPLPPIRGRQRPGARVVG